MKNIKRVCSLIVCFMMLFCMINISSAAEVDDTQSLEEKYPGIVNKINLFYELGVFDFEYAVDEYVTRADFAVILTRLLKAESMLETPSTQLYTDVKTDDYASENIALMYDMGIMTGKTKTEFYPDDELTLSEANSALVRLLGYDSKAYAKGGWSSGFNMTANDLGINKGVPSELNLDYLPAGSLAVMLFNAMEVKMAGSFSTKDGGYVLSDSNKTLMYDYWNIVKDKGIVTCVGNISIFGVVKNQLEIDELEIDGAVFKSPYDEYKSYLGMNVDYYYYDDDTVYKHEIIMMNPGNNVKTVRIYSDSEARISGNTIIYYDKEKDKDVSYKVSGGAMIVRNGESVRNIVFPRNGYIDLISNDSSSYNVVMIYDFETFRVKGRVEDKLIFDYNAIVASTGTSSIELDNNTSFYTIIKNGTEIDYEKINIGDIVSVAYSRNAGYYIVVSSKKADIFIDGIESNPMKIIASDKEYLVNEDFLTLINNKVAGTSEILPGKFYSFSLDFMGNIYGMEEIKSEMSYGYLKGVRTDGAFADTVEVRLYSNLSGEFTVYPVKEKCILNGTSTTNSAVCTELQNVLANSDFDNPPVIKFRLDGKKNIDRVTTTTVAANDYTKISDDVIVRSRTADPINETNYTVWQTSLGFCTSTQNSAGNIFFDANIPIMKVPTSGDEEQFDIGNTTAILPRTDNEFVPMTFYDLSEFNYPGFVIYFSTSQGSNVKIRNNMYGVESVFTAVNEKGEQVGGLEYWDNGTLKKGYTSEDDNVINALNALQKGDIIQFNLDGVGDICAVEKMFSYHSSQQVDTSVYATDGALAQRIRNTGIEGNWSAIFKFKSGKIAGNKTVMRFDSSVQSSVVYRASAQKFTFYDGEKFYSGTVDSIEQGDTLIIIGNSADMDTFIVLKNLQTNYDLYTDYNNFTTN